MLVRLLVSRSFWKLAYELAATEAKTEGTRYLISVSALYWTSSLAFRMLDPNWMLPASRFQNVRFRRSMLVISTIGKVISSPSTSARITPSVSESCSWIT